ncbi:protein of unknown function (DUF4200) [Carpediemonas membranifera]|uniref:DUF4200 domain-containing protein n=1 Tax=Carpediemonas membranifera TaxID=201153 RepID=A0A8J6E6B2_9EUKA|nr:protein of unknown function (DUF4200) [Carpediemonas membranifera]|eukprot:KAG9396892.1 protein of unknown function (DUF4200) [Carpediemonas membranifera]
MGSFPRNGEILDAAMQASAKGKSTKFTGTADNGKAFGGSTENKAAFITELIHEGTDEALEGVMPFITTEGKSADEMALIQAKRELSALQARVDQKKVEMDELKLVWQRKETELIERQAELRTQVTRFQKFVAENNGKKSRAEMKARREADEVKGLDDTADELRKELESLHAERQSIEEKLQAMRPFEDFIGRAAELAGTDDVMFKHETLMSTRAELTRTIQGRQQEADEKRAAIASMKVEMSTSVLAAQNRAAKLSAELDRRDSQALELSADKALRESHESQMAETLASVRIAIVSLELRAAKAFRQRREVLGRPTNPADYPRLVTRVGELIGQYKGVVERATALSNAK